MLIVEQVPLERLFLSPANPRLNDAAVPHVVASIRRFGWRQPVVAKRSGEVIAGNTRLKAAQKMGCETVPVHWFEGSDLEATAFAIADNKTAEFAEWDEPALAQLLQELKDEEALDGVGYTPEDLDDLLASLSVGDEGAQLDDPGPGDPPEDPVTQKGDLWILGDMQHRLLCGDSTCKEDVLRVMDGQLAALVSTDPPYLVDYTGERPNDSGKDWTDVYHEVDIKDAEGFFRAVFQNVIHVIAPHAAIYCWHAHKRQALIASCWERLGILDHQQVIWVKPTPVFGRVFWHFQHEPCMMGWVQGSKPEHDGSHDYSSVWMIDWEGKARFSGDHPTTKPVEIFARPMRKHTKQNDICFEPFSGSGSQLIAAEANGRRCYAIEIEPAFVDVAVKRWQEATGKQATLYGTQEIFDDRCEAHSS